MKIAVRTAFGITTLGDSKEYYELFQRVKDNELLDRLFRKYVRREDANKTAEALATCAENFSKSGKLRISKLKDLVIRGARQGEYDLEDYGKYFPVRIILYDLPFSVIADDIPLEDYDNNDGEPFWMRPEYIIEKYSKVKKI